MRPALFCDVMQHTVVFLTDVSGNPIGSIFKGITTLCCVITQKSADFIYFMPEA